jgi:hypothetical protein
MGYWNALALVCVMAVPGILWWAGRRGASQTSLFVSSGALAVVITALMLTYSRSGLLGLILVLVIVLWMVPGRIRMLSVLIGGSIGALLPVVYGLTTDALTDDALIAADLHAIGASLAGDGFLSLGGTGDISSVGVIGADMIANSQFGNVGIDTTLSARGIRGGEVQGAGLDGSVSGTGLINASLLGLTQWGDADLASQSTAVGLDNSILGAGFGDNSITGISRVSVDSLSSTDHGDASALHYSKSVGVLANAASPTLVTSGADLVAIAEDTSYVTAMTSQGQATSHSSSETVGISGAEVSLFGDDSNLVVNASSKASAISSSNA